jgi:TRAP-type C4-dicarboxylate transport system substrate-binding protein
MKKVLWIVLALTLVVSILLLSACSSSAPNTTAAPKTTAPAQTTTSAPPPSSSAALVTSAPPSAAPQTSTAATTYTLKIASAQPKTSSQIIAAQWFCDEVTTRTNGRVKFQPFWGGTLVQQGEELNATQKGVVDLATIISIYFPNEIPLFGWDYAFMFSPSDPLMAEKMAQKLMSRPEVLNNIEQYNMKVLGHVIVGSYNYNGTKPFKVLDDLKGVKVSVAGTQMPRWVQAAGGVPVMMGAPDKYMALQTGVTGGSILSTEGINSFKLFEVGKYITNCDIGSPIGNALCINKDSFNKLPADIQKIMVDVGNEEGPWNAANLGKINEAAVKNMATAGAITYDLPTEEKMKWANVVPNLPSEWAKQMDSKGLAGTTLVNFYLQAAKDLGYKWPREWTVQ